MENEEKKEKKKQFIDDKGQRFYFNEEGKLIVESNKGVWEDGEPHVKMYGNFQCNAKTLGIIINKFRGCPVVIKETHIIVDTFLWRDGCKEETTSIVNPTEEDKELMQELENVSTQRDGLMELKNEYMEANDKFQKAIDKFNKLPWWKRIFKKVEV